MSGAPDANASAPLRVGSHIVRLVEARPLTPHVRGLWFEVVSSSGQRADFRYDAGQYVELHVSTDTDGIVKRAYSLASPPPSDGPAGTFELAVTRVADGPGSEELHRLQVGAEIPMDGPIGLFTRIERHRRDAVARGEPECPALFVGTGTGGAPLRAIIRDELAKRKEASHLALLFGARTERDILWREELNALAHGDPRFTYDVTLSRGSAEWPGRRGYVQTHLRELLTRPELARAHVYICGLSAMVSDVRDVLKRDLGVDRGRVHSERYD